MAILFFFTVYCRLTDPNFWHFPKKKSNDVVKLFFILNDSFNLKDEHSNSIEKNRSKNWDIFYSILCVLSIQVRKYLLFNAAMFDISRTSFSSSYWKVRDAGISHRSFDG